MGLLRLMVRLRTGGTFTAQARILALAVLGVGLGCGQVADSDTPAGLKTPGTFSVLSLNTENLFDTENNPGPGDDEFTPEGTQLWTPRVLADKMRNLAEIVLTSRAEVVGLVEIENAKVLETWRKQYLELAGYKYSAISPRGDGRGIRNAVVSKLPILGFESHSITPQTREILEVFLDISPVNPSELDAARPDQRVHLMVNHWPSRRGGEDSAKGRLQAALKLRDLVGDRLQQNPSAFAIAVGDFNDDVTDDAFVHGLPLARFPNMLPNGPRGMMYALDFEWISKPSDTRGTYYYHQGNQWNALDHILVAGTKSKIKAVEKSFQVLNFAKFAKSQRYPRGCDIRARKELRDVTRCPFGATDHRPVTATFAASGR